MSVNTIQTAAVIQSELDKLQRGSEEVKGLKMELSVHPWN